MCDTFVSSYLYRLMDYNVGPGNGSVSDIAMELCGIWCHTIHLSLNLCIASVFTFVTAAPGSRHTSGWKGLAAHMSLGVGTPLDGRC